MKSFFLSFAGGLALTLTQILLVCAVQGDVSVAAYRRLLQWDSGHYLRLVDTGYINTLPPLIGDTDPSANNFHRNTNAAFFPGYVVAARTVRDVTGITSGMALLLTAALAALGFWSTLLMLMRAWKLSGRVQSLALLAVFIHPAAFFLVAGYSESLFLFGLTGFIFWSRGKTVKSGLLAAVHGIVMTATRIFGIPLVVYPIVTTFARSGTRNERVRRMLTALPVAVGAALGAVAFFVYSSLVLGKWNLYMRVQAKGWGIIPDYFFPFRPPRELFVPALWPLTGNNLSQAVTTLTLLLLITGIILEFRMRRRSDALRAERIGLWTCALLSFYVSAAALATVGFRSMLRYSFIPYVLIVLAAVLLFRDVRLGRTGKTVVVLLGGAVLITSFALEIFFIRAFTNGLWVA